MQNLFADIPGVIREERFDELLKTSAFRLERIVSRGHRSPEGFWYDQDHTEWVLLLQGRAVLAFENEPRNITMESGDYMLIPAHTRHRILSTDPDHETIWLAIHYGKDL